MTDALVVDGLSRRYGGRWALSLVRFRLEAGQTLALVGRNGSGKSTLLKLLAAALRPHRGEAQVLGSDLRREPDEVRRKTALLAHVAYTWEALSGLENLETTARLLQMPDPEERSREALDEVGLTGRGEDPVCTYSAGMRKRLALARTLLQDAPLVLLDEPYGALDPPGFRLIDSIVRRLQTEGRTVVLATHQLERGAALADQGLVLEAGQVFWQGPASQLVSHSGLLAGSQESGV